MRRIITDPLAPKAADRPLGVRILWFVGIWAASIVVAAGVAEGLKRLILG